MEKEMYHLLKDALYDQGAIRDGLEKTLQEYEQRQHIRAQAVSRLLGTIPGEDPDREGILDTPLRVARMYEELFGGYEMDPRLILSATFGADGDSEADIYNNGIVAVKEIPFYSHCEHHMVPFFGHAWIAYIPQERVVGISKLARLTDCFAKRLQIQEKMTNQIADATDKWLQPQGVMVVIQAEHLCMAMRGIKKPGTSTATSAVRGVFVKPEVREECMGIFGLRGR